MVDECVFQWQPLQEFGDGVPRDGVCGWHPVALRRREKGLARALARSAGQNGVDQLSRTNHHLHHLDVRSRFWDVWLLGPRAVVVRCPSHLGRAGHRVEMVDGPLHFRPGQLGMAIAHLLAHPADEGKGELEFGATTERCVPRATRLEAHQFS